MKSPEVRAEIEPGIQRAAPEPRGNLLSRTQESFTPGFFASEALLLGLSIAAIGNKEYGTALLSLGMLTTLLAADRASAKADTRFVY